MKNEELWIRKTLLVMCHISPWNSVGGKNYLPDLIFSGSERTGTRKKIIFPHAVKSIIVVVLLIVPVVIEVVKPMH